MMPGHQPESRTFKLATVNTIKEVTRVLILLYVKVDHLLGCSLSWKMKPTSVCNRTLKELQMFLVWIDSLLGKIDNLITRILHNLHTNQLILQMKKEIIILCVTRVKVQQENRENNWRMRETHQQLDLPQAWSVRV